MSERPNLSEIRTLGRLGAPIIAASLFQMGMGVMDTLMAGQYASADLAGVAVASAIFGPTLILVIGGLGGITPIIAQMFGASRVADVGALVRSGFWLALGVGVVAVVLLVNADRVVQLIATDGTETSMAVARGYLQAVVWGFPGLALYAVLRGTCEGLGRTRPAMVIAGVVLVLNGFLNYAFIFGHFGAPELGGVGCGVATAIVFWLEALGMFMIIRRREYKSAAIFAGSWVPDLSAVARITRIGVPIAVTMFFEMGLYSLVTLLLAEFGDTSVAAHAIAMNVNGIAFMIPMSLGMAAAIRVGHCVGAGQFDQAAVVGQATFRLALGFAVVVAVGLGAARFWVVGLYTDDAQVQLVAANCLLFVALYQFVDDTQVTAIGTLRGYKDTRIPMLYAMFGYWVVALPVALTLGYGWLSFEAYPAGFGIYGFWGGLTCGLTFVAITLNVRRVRLARDEARIRALAASDVRSSDQDAAA